MLLYPLLFLSQSSRDAKYITFYTKIEETIKISDGYLFELLGVNLSAILAFQLTLIS